MLFQISSSLLVLLNYVPIRSEGKRERCFNQAYWVEDISDILVRYQIYDTDYYKCPWMYQAAYLIERLLDRKIPVEINAMEHSRTCIGYNHDSLIFADNWGMNHQETSDNPYNDRYSAGFSTINKWAIYTWIRDLVYLKPDDEAMDTSPKAKTRKTGPKSHKINHRLVILDDEEEEEDEEDEEEEEEEEEEEDEEEEEEEEEKEKEKKKEKE